MESLLSPHRSSERGDARVGLRGRLGSVPLGLACVLLLLGACESSSSRRSSDAAVVADGSDGVDAGDTDVPVDGSDDVTTVSDVADTTEPEDGTSADTADVVEPPLPTIEVLVDREVRDRMVTLIATAEKSVDLFEFEFVTSGSGKDVRNALWAAASRGIEVRVMLDDEPDGNAEMVDMLESGGCTVRIHSHSKRLHLKVLIVDGDTLMLGSTNISGASLDFNHEANVIVRQPETVAFIAQHVDDLWDAPWIDPSVTSGSSHEGMVPWIDGGYGGLVHAALDSATDRVEAVIYGVNLNPDYPNGPTMLLAEALADVASRGVDVRVLMDYSDWNSTQNMLNEEAGAWFSSHGIEVRYDAPDVTNHAKVLLVDDQAFVGTNNWSYSGMEVDHEAGISFRDTEAFAVIEAWVAEQWAVGTP